MRNKIFTKIIITTLLVTLLTFNVGRVTRVSAVGTTAAIAGTAFILTGAVYLSYVALTQGEMILPASEEMHEWLGSIGKKVSQYPSGVSAYQEIYQGLARSPVHNAIDGVWTWTQERIKSFVNDFSDTRLIQNITSYEQAVDASLEVTNHYTYDFDIVPWPEIIYTYTAFTFDQFIARYGGDITFGEPILYRYYNGSSYSYGLTYVADDTLELRNILRTNNSYGIQVKNSDGVFVDTSLRLGINTINGIYGPGTSNGVMSGYSNAIVNLSYDSTFPLLTQADTYIQSTGEIIHADEVVTTRTNFPSWVDPDNENRPIIPWVPIPNIPTGIPTPPGYTGTPQWGFPLQDLLDLLEDLARALIDIGAIGELINQFAGQHGDEYYLSYNEGDTNYYTYYQPTIFDNDTEYVTYNINISEQEDVIPVDLNTISLYTENRYLEQIKQSAIAGSSIIRDLAVFWYDVDPEVTYIVLGCCIVVLIGAFTGKLGHS